MSDRNAAVAIYEGQVQAEAALQELQRAGFDMKRLSVAGRDYRKNKQVATQKGFRFGAAFWVPGIGALLVGGPLASQIIGSLEASTMMDGPSPFIAGLHCVGIPESSVVEYETAVKANRFVLIAHGSPAEVSRANQILDGTQRVSLASHLEQPLLGV